MGPGFLAGGGLQTPYAEQQAITATTPAAWASMAVGDIDNDGSLEVLLGGKSCQIFRPTALGLKSLATLATSGLNSETVYIGDIDADGNRELVISGFGSGAPYVDVWRWDGATATKIHTDTWADDYSWATVVGQLGPTSSYQIAVGSWNDATRNLRLRVYDAALGAFDEYTWHDAGATSPNIWTQPGIIGDVDNDGNKELVMFGRDAAWRSVVRIFRWVSGVGLSHVSDTFGAANSEWHGGLMADVDGDGTSEIVLGGWKTVGGRHVACLQVWSLNFAGMLAEATWDYGGDTEIWYLRASGRDITCFGGSYGYPSQHFTAYRYAAGVLTKQFEEQIPTLAGYDNMVLETGYIGDVNADGVNEVVLAGWWSLASTAVKSWRAIYK